MRREWCLLSKDTGKFVLDRILSGETREAVVASIHEYLEVLATSMRAGQVAVPQYVITKGLNKAPHEYPDAKSQPHVQVRATLCFAFLSFSYPRFAVVNGGAGSGLGGEAFVLPKKKFGWWCGCIHLRRRVLLAPGRCNLFMENLQFASAESDRVSLSPMRPHVKCDGMWRIETMRPCLVILLCAVAGGIGDAESGQVGERGPPHPVCHVQDSRRYLTRRTRAAPR